ncbi:MAG: hypothetical protein ACRDZU_10200 [Acidimicrobiales bacterium]
MVDDSTTATILARLARPYDPSKVLGALLGLPPRVARQLVGAILATSDEAEALLDAMPHIVRSMAIATTDKAERCYGELRGPVLWSETMSARSASAGDPGLFVCATTTKAYDTDENRVLKAALDAIRRAGVDAVHGSDAWHDDVARRARHNGNRASHLLEHRTLSGVPVTRVRGRAMTRTRAGNRRSTYRPAIDLLRRAADPVGVTQLEAYADDATRTQLALLAQAIRSVEERTGAPVALRSSHGSLVGGPLAYDHLGGITVDGRLITGPDDL